VLDIQSFSGFSFGFSVLVAEAQASRDVPAPGVTFFEEQIVPYQLSKGVVIHASFKGEQDDRWCAVVGLRCVGVLVLGVEC
jgi:hypothetical protein